MPKIQPENLKALSDDLDSICRTYPEIIKQEPKIGKPLIEARDEARALRDRVSEGRAAPEQVQPSDHKSENPSR